MKFTWARLVGLFAIPMAMLLFARSIAALDDPIVVDVKPFWADESNLIFVIMLAMYAAIRADARLTRRANPPEMDPLAARIRNEQLKLLANLLNGMAVTTFLSIVILPFLSSGRPMPSVLTGLAAAAILHMGGQLALGAMRQER